MRKRFFEKFTGYKLNKKFTLVILIFVIIPIAVLAAVLFRNMEQNVVNENLNYMQYTMERNIDNMKTNVDSINMTTQFFLSDTSLKTVLNSSVTGKTMLIEDLLDFYDSDVASLERLVNNNPLLYGVRVYATNDNVQEMMPILYGSTRMNKLSWSSKRRYTGWNYNYEDTLFDNQQNTKGIAIGSLITPIMDYRNGTIGYIETAMKMRSMFPSLYEAIENEWSCFASDTGNLYFGDNEQKNSRAFARAEMSDGINKDGEIHTYYKTGKDTHMVISYVYIKEVQGALFSAQDITSNINNVYDMRTQFIVTIIIIAIALAFIINYTVKQLLKQFYQILSSIRCVQKGDLDVRIENCKTDEMGELGTQINTMLDRIQRLMEDNIKRELLAKNSEIRALQNQINAHFIYNVLESIKMMAEIDEKYEISDAITALGKLLRYSMKWVSGNVLVEEELEYIKNYLALINLRFDYAIYLSINIPEQIMKQEIPKMSLQPIVENAIYHGIEQMAEDTNIYIKGIIKGEDFMIEITDAGRGMTEEELQRLEKKIAGEIETSGGSGNGIGLKNVQDRIRIAFGEKYGIHFASKYGCYTKVMIDIPLRRSLKDKPNQS